MFGDFWGYIGKLQVLSKTAVATFWKILGTNWATFYSGHTGWNAHLPTATYWRYLNLHIFDLI